MGFWNDWKDWLDQLGSCSFVLSRAMKTPLMQGSRLQCLKVLCI